MSFNVGGGGGVAICPQRAHFSSQLSLLNVLSEIVLLSLFEHLLVPLPALWFPSRQLEGGVACQHHRLVSGATGSPLSPQLQALLCESRLRAVQ